MLDHIDWKAPENTKVKRRPFKVNVEEDVARAFIKAVHDQGLYVRETVVKLMREFSRCYMKQETDDAGTDSEQNS